MAAVGSAQSVRVMDDLAFGIRSKKGGAICDWMFKGERQDDQQLMQAEITSGLQCNSERSSATGRAGCGIRDVMTAAGVSNAQYDLAPHQVRKLLSLTRFCCSIRCSVRCLLSGAFPSRLRCRDQRRVRTADAAAEKGLWTGHLSTSSGSTVVFCSL